MAKETGFRKTTFGRVTLTALLCGMAFNAIAAEPAWNPGAIRECDRAGLVDYMQRHHECGL